MRKVVSAIAVRPRTLLGPEKPPDAKQSPVAEGSAAAAAFQAVVLPHLDAAYTLARYLTRRGEAADDIVQEAMLRAYRGFSGRRGINVRAWLLAIVRNCFLTWHARNRAKLEDFQTEWEQACATESDEAGKDQETPETILIKQQESTRIRALIETIPHQFREVLVLRDIEDMSYREIAEITDVSIGTVMSRLARARKMFAAAWKKTQMQASKEIQ